MAGRNARSYIWQVTSASISSCKLISQFERRPSVLRKRQKLIKNFVKQMWRGSLQYKYFLDKKNVYIFTLQVLVYLFYKLILTYLASVNRARVWFHSGHVSNAATWNFCKRKWIIVVRKRNFIFGKIKYGRHEAVWTRLFYWLKVIDPQCKRNTYLLEDLNCHVIKGVTNNVVFTWTRN